MRLYVYMLALASLGALPACVSPSYAPAASRSVRPPALARRALTLPPGSGWTGNGICYGPHRAGQHPAGPQPTVDQIREDLRLMQPHWRMLRMYNSRGAGAVAQIIREEHLGMSMMVGAWIAPEAPGTAAENAAQLAEAIRIANAYPDVVMAVSVGNETQVFWSAHKVDQNVLLDCIRQVRASTKVPVTTADDFRFWTTPESRQVADEVDFITLHVYALWNGQPLDSALAFTRQQYAAVAAMHPGVPIVLGEAGWATCKHTEGDQAKLIQGTPGEAEQKVFYEQFRAWTTQAQVPNFYFEAFDEPWKGGAHPDEVEKHWGLFRADRTPKAALQE